MEHFLERIALLRHWYSKSNEKNNADTNFSSELTYQSLNRALPSRKCSIKATAKCKTSIYVLTEICLQRSQRLGHKYLQKNFYSKFETRILFQKNHHLLFYLFCEKL